MQKIPKIKKQKNDQKGHYCIPYWKIIVHTFGNIEQRRWKDGRDQETKEDARWDEIVCQLTLLLWQSFPQGLEHLTQFSVWKQWDCSSFSSSSNLDLSILSTI